MDSKANPAAPALLPSLHALVEELREIVAANSDGNSDDVKFCYYHRQFADKLESLLSRAATTQAAPVAFRVVGPKGKSDWQDANETDEPDGKTMLEVTREEAAKLDNVEEISIELAYAAPPSQPVAPVVPDDDASVICQECGADFYVVAGAKSAVCPGCNRTIFLVAAPHPAQQRWCPHVGGLGPPFPYCEKCAQEPTAADWHAAIMEEWHRHPSFDTATTESRAREIARERKA